MRPRWGSHSLIHFSNTCSSWDQDPSQGQGPWSTYPVWVAGTHLSEPTLLLSRLFIGRKAGVRGHSSEFELRYWRVGCGHLYVCSKTPLGCILTRKFPSRMYIKFMLGVHWAEMDWVLHHRKMPSRWIVFFQYLDCSILLKQNALYFSVSIYCLICHSRKDGSLVSSWAKRLRQLSKQNWNKADNYRTEGYSQILWECREETLPDPCRCGQCQGLSNVVFDCE